MKTCKYCGMEQPEESFAVCKVVGDKIYRRLKCQKCKLAGRNERRGRIRKWLDDYKKELTCERCGIADYRTLEFHHEDRDEKQFNVADMIRYGSSIQTTKREISKCHVLCANCHRIKHFEERGQN